VTLFPGDRFELAVTRQAWEAGRIPLAGGFQHLVGDAGEPAVVSLRSESGQSAPGVWDGGRALLEVPDLRRLVRLTGHAGRLTLEVEQADARVFRVGLASQTALADGAVDPAQRDLGGVPVRFARSDVDIVQALADGAHAPLDAYELNRWAHEIALTPGFDELVSLPFLREVIPYEHQVAAVKTVLNRMRGRALLADEVGLGKTVEAGIVLAELLRRRLARRVLVLVPPGLVTQWQEELRRKFRLDFVTHDAEAFKLEGPQAWRRFERVVASFHTAKRAEHAATILDVPYDLVIVDEAHHLRNARTVLWQFVNRLRRTYLLLLTATPVQNDLEELFNLVTLLQPGQLSTLRAFRREHVVRGDRRQPRDAEGLRRLLGEVMVRNRRATTPVALTRRVARTILVEPSPPERELYSGLSHFLRDRCRRGAESANGGRPPAGGRSSEITRMTLQTLQMELGSSPEAAAATLGRLLSKESWAPDTADALRRYRDLAGGLGEDAKSRALVSLLESWGDKLLVFTRFRATQEHLARVLGERGEPVAVYHGGLRRDEKEAAVRAFEGRCRVLISTEAGGEGRNLQFAHGLVNYDLPWNPMRIEQRIGRLSRVGQTREVHVFNLVAPGTIEEALLEVLDAKINMFELVIGEIDMILGQLATEQDFEDIVTDLWLASEDHDGFRTRIGSLGDQLLAAKRAYLEIREADDRIFGDALAPGGSR
jgi:SNF2 family DNA or RNA helicase